MRKSKSRPATHPLRARGRLAVAALSFLVAALGSPLARGAFAGNAGADVAVELDSLAAVEGLPGAVGGWVRYTYAMSIDCSPPSGCYAKSQRIYYLANCAGGALAQIQRVSLDMNDRVVAQTEPTFDTPWFLPAFGSPESTALRNICAGYALRLAPR